MFEDSLMESGNRIQRKNKFWSFVAFMLNAAALLALVIWPLLHPEALPRQVIATLMVAPAPPPAPPPAVPAQSVQPKVEMLISAFQSPSRIPRVNKQVNEAAIPPSLGAPRMEDIGGGIGSIINDMGTRQTAIVRPNTPKSLSVSSGVMAGNLLTKTLPQYPAIPRAARIQGTVVLQATISKSGSIENLRVMSGPPMLQQAAMDAVRSWRYKPYLLNGEPVEVETTVKVVFNLSE